MLIINY